MLFNVTKKIFAFYFNLNCNVRTIIKCEYYYYLVIIVIKKYSHNYMATFMESRNYSKNFK